MPRLVVSGSEWERSHQCSWVANGSRAPRRSSSRCWGLRSPPWCVECRIDSAVEQDGWWHANCFRGASFDGFGAAQRHRHCQWACGCVGMVVMEAWVAKRKS